MTTRRKYNPWVAVLLIGLFIGCQALADVGVTKFFQLDIGTLSIVAPAGALMYCFTYTLRDLIHKRLGKQWAHAAIVTAAAFNVFQAFVLWIATLLPSPVWFDLGDAWNNIFALLPAITIASIVAEVVSGLVDTEVYQAIWKSLGSRHQWVRVLGSNLAGMAVDSVLFAPLAFTILPGLFGADTIPFMMSFTIGLWGKVIQVALMLFSLPWIYLVPDRDETL